MTTLQSTTTRIATQTEPVRPIEPWLDAATRHLSAAAAERARDELYAHYQDAVDDYLQDGFNAADANRRALHDLGSSDVTNAGFNDVHRGGLFYAVGSFCSFMMVMLLGFLPFAIVILAGSDRSAEQTYAVTTLFMGGLTWAGLICLSRLLRWRHGFDFAQTTRPLYGIIVGLMLNTLAVAALAIFSTVDFEVVIAGTLADHDLLTLEGLLLLAVNAGRLIAAVAVLALTRTLFRGQAALTTLLRVVAVAALVMGVTMLVTVGVTWIVGETPWLWLFQNIATGANLLVWALLALAFYHAYAYPGLRYQGHRVQG